MACNSSTCQSNCYKSGDDGLASPAAKLIPSFNSGNNSKNLCVKCKTSEPILCGGSRDEERFCKDCFRSNLFGKFKFAVTSHAMITPSDNVLVAFSGGPSSRVALQFVHEMQKRAQKNYDASRDRSLPVFGVGVAFIDFGAIYPNSSPEIEGIVHEIKSIVSDLSPPMKKLHVFPIESIYSSNTNDGRNKIRNLLGAVTDATGKEDLLLHLRMRSLQKIASDNGYSRIVLGSCTSRISCHVIAATVKGQGYTLAADIQYVDARREIPAVLPLRDCLLSELNMLCCIDGLKTVELPNNYHSSINGLISSFVAKLQEENPSRECTIVRTAGKLIPFDFNKIPEISDSNVPLATRRRQKRLNLKSNDSISSESFCAICYGPLNKSDVIGLRNLEDRMGISEFFKAACCSSCQFQILPKDAASIGHFLSLLPRPLVTQPECDGLDNLSSLREQIQEFLLPDSDC